MYFAVANSLTTLCAHMYTRLGRLIIGAVWLCANTVYPERRKKTRNPDSCKCVVEFW